MTKSEYENRFMTELEDMWNDSARFQYLHWDQFVNDMFNNMKESEEC